MTEPATEQRPTGGRVRERHWDAVAAVIASLVGLLALIVAGYTAWIQRQQVSAQVWPYLIGGRNGALSQLVWINKGVGPAIVRTVQVTIDGKPQPDWQSVRKSLGLASFDYAQSFLNGNVLSPGETVGWIKFSSKADYDSFLGAARRANMNVEVCYCSTLGDCWKTRFASTGRRPVAQCEQLPEAGQFRD